MNVKVIWSEREYQTREADDDGWDRGDFAVDADGFEAVKTDVYSDKWNDVFEVSDDAEVLVGVIVRYTTGNTFGNTSGVVQVMDVFDNIEDAEALIKVLTDDQYKGSGSGRHYNWNREYKGKEYYVNWLGYFESLDSIEAMVLTVR